jgi:hypothetical protein
MLFILIIYFVPGAVLVNCVHMDHVSPVFMRCGPGGPSGPGYLASSLHIDIRYRDIFYFSMNLIIT